jgi:hypothetical protein
MEMIWTRYSTHSDCLYINDALFEDIYKQMEESNRFKIQCEKYSCDRNDRIEFSAKWYGDETHYYFLLPNEERRRIRKILRDKMTLSEGC